MKLKIVLLTTVALCLLAVGVWHYAPHLFPDLTMTYAPTAEMWLRAWKCKILSENHDIRLLPARYGSAPSVVRFSRNQIERVVRSTTDDDVRWLGYYAVCISGNRADVEAMVLRATNDDNVRIRRWAEGTISQNGE